MIKHVVTFVWRDGVSPDEVAALLEQLRALPAQVDALVDYSVGPDLGLTKGTGDFAVVATVGDADGLRAYLAHPAHVPVAQRLRGLALSRTAVQFEAQE